MKLVRINREQIYDMTTGLLYENRDKKVFITNVSGDYDTTGVAIEKNGSTFWSWLCGSLAHELVEEE